MYTIQKYICFWLKRAIIVLIIAVLSLSVPMQEAHAAWGYGDIMALISNKLENHKSPLMFIGGDSLMGANQSVPPKTMSVVITGYSSTSDQTDDSPFITASNTKVRDGIVASNFLAFGTKVQIPEIYGDKVFTVEDRMAKKHSDKIDIWFPERYLARQFGVKTAEVLILE